MISNILFVGFGGALGAISRFGINEIMERYLINSSSYSVLLVNVIGCFLIGLIIGTSMPEKNTMYYFFIIGFLGVVIITPLCIPILYGSVAIISLSLRSLFFS